jgi:hypothetical protein
LKEFDLSARQPVQLGANRLDLRRRGILKHARELGQARCQAIAGGEQARGGRGDVSHQLSASLASSRATACMVAGDGLEASI